jgi:hypothetical protein
MLFKNINLTFISYFFRPPFGNCNEACAKVLQGEMGLTIVQWNCDSNDWQYANVEDQPKLFTNIADKINPSDPTIDSFITLQHDIKDYSIEYIPKIIELISGKGYKFVTVEQCLGGEVPAYTVYTKVKAGNLSLANIVMMIILGIILLIFSISLIYYKDGNKSHRW